MIDKEKQGIAIIKNHIQSITEYECYEFWLKCTCGYEQNSAIATFCGGCGHNIRLPNYVQKVLDTSGVLSLYTEDGQWYAFFSENYEIRKIALKPELNGTFEI